MIQNDNQLFFRGEIVPFFTCDERSRRLEISRSARCFFWGGAGEAGRGEAEVLIRPRICHQYFLSPLSFQQCPQLSVKQAVTWECTAPRHPGQCNRPSTHLRISDPVRATVHSKFISTLSFSPKTNYTG